MGFGIPPAISRTGGQYARSATLTVAALDSNDKTNVDYSCDGTDDQVEINAALNALPAGGGMVMLLEGTFDITGDITIPKNNVALVGQGAGTVLAVSGGAYTAVYASGKDHVLVASLRVDGTGGPGTQYGIRFATVTHSKVVDCWVENMSHYGIIIVSSDNNTIKGNNVQNGYYGIHLSGSGNNTIKGNNVQSNGRYGIYLLSGSDNNTITGNNCQGNYQGIGIDHSSNNTITGNNCQSNGREGIFLWSSSNNTITGNNVQSNGRYGISINYSSDNNTVVGNTVVGNSQSADNAYDGIYLYALLGLGANYNLIEGNLVRRGTTANKQKYGINVSNDACNRNCLIGNDLYDSGSTGDLNDVPFTNPTLKHDNRDLAGTGWLAEV